MQTIYTFNDHTVGRGASAMVMDSGSNIFVLTGSYTNEADTIVEFSAASRAPSVIGTVPVADVALAAQAAEANSLTLVNGNFYGTTYDGGPTDDGTLFELPAGQTTGTMLADFTDATAGRKPQGTPYVDAAGNIFGTYYEGGPSGYGGVYEFTATSQQLSSFASFDGNLYAHPLGNLVNDSSGNLYGTATEGGDDTYGNPYGGMFEIDLQTRAINNCCRRLRPHCRPARRRQWQLLWLRYFRRGE
jgi:uncharacterized repeat protein (TIGR03803 family)